jgi:hypothetical protein
MEIEIAPEDSSAIHRNLMFDARFHDADGLIAGVPAGVLDHETLPAIAAKIQAGVRTGPAVEEFVDHLRQATQRPGDYGIALDGVDMQDLIVAGASPRGMSMLVRAAKVAAWLAGRIDLSRRSARRVPRGRRIASFRRSYELQRVSRPRIDERGVASRSDSDSAWEALNKLARALAALASRAAAPLQQLAFRHLHSVRRGRGPSGHHRTSNQIKGRSARAARRCEGSARLQDAGPEQRGSGCRGLPALPRRALIAQTDR